MEISFGTFIFGVMTFAVGYAAGHFYGKRRGIDAVELMLAKEFTEDCPKLYSDTILKMISNRRNSL